MRTLLITWILFYCSLGRAAFTSSSSLSWVNDLAVKANCIIKQDKLLKDIEAAKFTHTNSTSLKVVQDFKSIPAIKIATYKTKNPFSKAIATTYPSDKETIYLNLRANPRELSAMLNTVCHEATHILGYSHGDNSPKGKEDSVPYKVGSLCQKYFYLCK